MVDGGVYSWKEHLKKPSKGIFDTLIKIFDLNKEEAIWIDKNYKEKGIIRVNNWLDVKYVFNENKEVLM